MNPDADGELYATIEGTPYRWVGNLPDLRKPNGWDRLAMMFPQTTQKSWKAFLKDAIYSKPVAWQGHTTAELAAADLVAAWKPVGAESLGHTIPVDEDRGLFNFSFDD